MTGVRNRAQRRKENRRQVQARKPDVSTLREQRIRRQNSAMRETDERVDAWRKRKEAGNDRGGRQDSSVMTFVDRIRGKIKVFLVVVVLVFVVRALLQL